MVFKEATGDISFKKHHPKINICLAEGLEVSRAKWLTSATFHTFYQNLENLYIKHKYPPNHI
jgi:hypothetical protein